MVDCFDQWDEACQVKWVASLILPMGGVLDEEFSFVEWCYHKFV